MSDLLEQLRAHRMLSKVPDAEREWLMAHGTLEQHSTGDVISHKGEPVPGLFVVLKGRMSHFTNQAGTWRKVMDWHDGDIAGLLPYSRLTVAPGNTVIDEPTELLTVLPADIAAIPVACPQLTAALVHAMIDRTREFKASDLQSEKLASLGKLSAGLAHELNNPASAAARSAQLLGNTLTESEDASRALGAAQLTADELEAVERVRTLSFSGPATNVLSPLDRADRVDSIADWLADHDSDDSFAASLAETDVSIEALDEVASVLSSEKLGPALRWIAAGCAVRGLTRDIERASSRVHDLVSAVKRFTHMDQAKAPEAVDIRKGLTDTLAMLASKARDKSVTLSVDAPAELPTVTGFGGELNQVWLNLIDNALDAVATGGRVVASARAEGTMVVVRVTDNGPGIPGDIKQRIFEPFFTTKPVGQGTGMGLDIVHRLVGQNGGRIDVESAPGKTEFRVALPAIA